MACCADDKRKLRWSMEAIARGESHFKEKDVKPGMCKLRACGSAHIVLCDRHIGSIAVASKPQR